jgi:prepilin-type N-terminal cleavage/methylation domain-containing protein
LERAGRTPAPPSSHVRRAFTFIEILATIALLAIVLPSVMAGISISLTAGGLARQQAQASSLANGKMMELAVAGQWEHAILSGDFSPDQPDFRWTAQVADWDGTALRQLDVTVSWSHRGKDRSVTVSTLVNTQAAASAAAGAQP